MRSYLLGAAAAIAIVLGFSAFTGDAPKAPPTAIVADTGAAFEEVVLQFDPEVIAEVGPTYRDLLRALSPTVSVWVAVERDAHFETFLTHASAWGLERMERFRPVVVGVPISTWSRDRYTLVRRGDRRLLLVPPRPNRGHQLRRNDWMVPAALARAAGDDVEVVIAPAIFDGGDLIATDEYVFVTALLASRNQAGDLSKPEHLTRWLEETTGRRPILLGRHEDQVPGHHIGMFLTPLGGDVVLVGDPDLGLAMLPANAELPLPVDRTEATLERFRFIARALEAAGFHLRRVPLVPLAGGLTYVTYNNSVLERREDGRLHAYVPQFGIAPLDAAGRRAYEAAGAVVHPIDVRKIYSANGTVRCLLNVLRRGS